MKENDKIEQQLDEEKLQSITGGCGTCFNATTQAANLLADNNRIRINMMQHVVEDHPQDYRLLQGMQNTILRNHARVGELLNGIEERHPQPQPFAPSTPPRN